MRSLLPLLVGSSLLCLPDMVLAQESDEPSAGATRWNASPPLPSHDGEKDVGHPGVAVNLSVGYAIPAGNSTGAAGDSLSATFKGQFPISVELGGDVTPSLFIGVYGTYAPGGVSSQVPACASGSSASCSAHSFRAGFTVAYRFLPGEMIRPWIGYGIGYEWQTVTITDGALPDSGTASIKGWEFGHFKAGFDVQANETVGIGPFIDVGLGQYNHIHTQGGDQPVDENITQSALHEWVTIGVRVAIAP